MRASLLRPLAAVLARHRLGRFGVMKNAELGDPETSVAASLQRWSLARALEIFPPTADTTAWRA